MDTEVSAAAAAANLPEKRPENEEKMLFNVQILQMAGRRQTEGEIGDGRGESVRDSDVFQV